MNKKEEIYKFFAQNAQLERQTAIKRVIKEFVVTETTAATYYAAWRKDFMEPSTNPKTLINNSIKVDLDSAVKESGIKTTISVRKEEKVIPTVESKEETAAKKPEVIKPVPTIKLIPIMFKGPVFTFSINKDGIKIVDGESELITEDIVKEQQAALKIFNDLYVGKVQKEACHE